MIQVSNLSKAYGRQVVFDDITFTVNPGERVGLVGRNGHGKTTLLKMITGEERPDSGSISVPAGYRIGYLSQHLSFSQETVRSEACLALPRAEDGRDESYKADTVLMGLGFGREELSMPPLDLSGGYQVRLHLAKLLVSVPNILLLDEPTNYLDIVSIRWLTRFLREWKGELILITHDRDFMDGVSTHTMGIHRCRVKKIPGPTYKLYDQILMEEEVYEKTRINEERKRQELQQFINRFRAQATRARAVQSKIKALQKRDRLERLTDISDLEFQFSAAPFTGKTLLETRDLSFSFEATVASGQCITPGQHCRSFSVPEAGTSEGTGAPLPSGETKRAAEAAHMQPGRNVAGGQRLIEGLCLSVGKRDRIAVIGKNGRGKTTLLNLLAGELQPSSGAVARHPQLKTAYFGQTNIQRLDPTRTVEEEILGVMQEGNRKAARSICGIMMFEGDSALKKVSVLSGGEKSRVLLGKLLVSPANLLLLDEPTNHLDMESVDSLLGALDAFAGAVIIVTHSEMILHAMVNRLVVFDGGKVRVFEGSYQDFLDRVGWKGEEEAAGPAREAVKEYGGMSRKDLKRMRAELIDSRSRTLGPMEVRISEVEEEIMRLEKQVEEDTESLVKASVKGEGEAIKRLSKSIHEAKARIEDLFDELQELTSRHAEESREFSLRLKELSEDPAG